MAFQPPWYGNPNRSLAGRPPGGRHVSGGVLLTLPDLGIEHIGALEEIGLGRTRHEAGDRDARILQFGPQSERE